MPTPESIVKKKLKEELEKMWVLPTTESVRRLKLAEETGEGAPMVGWYFMPAANGMGEAGVADFVMCIMGQYYEVEVKAKGKAPTKLQGLHGKIIDVAGGHWVCVDGLDAVDEYIKYLRQDVKLMVGARLMANSVRNVQNMVDANANVKH